MVKLVTPKVTMIARPDINWEALEDYLERIGGTSWIDPCDPYSDTGEDLVEFASRFCYRSFDVGLNPNVTKIRTDRADYFNNILRSGHGSVLEHANYTFIFENVSRVFTHELVRHRAGTAVSQESMRYVRLTELPFWMPEWAEGDSQLQAVLMDALRELESIQAWLTAHFKLDDPGTSFAEKKAVTSFMRRFAPDGVATSMVWTANVRALRHVIATRTDSAAEEEIRLVFDEVAQIMKRECPLLFADFQVDGTGAWVPEYGKV